MSLHRTMYRVGLLVAVFAVVILLARRCEACLAEYRSIDWQIARSRLVVLAEVVRVDEVDEEPNETKRRRYEEYGKPAVATLRILRVMKGNYPGTEVRVLSGPIRSCAPYEAHANFQVGDRAIYILPGYPTDGKSRLIWGGSRLHVKESNFVESTLARLQAFRSQYLEELRRTSLKNYQAALLLREEMTQSAAKWPIARYRQFGKYSESYESGSVELENAKNSKVAEQSLVDRLVGIDLEVIRAAIALDWLSNEPIPWSEHPIWTSAVDQVANARRQEFLTLERTRIEKLLSLAGMKREQSENFLARLPEELKLRLQFPPVTPHLSKFDLTTDFIVRYFDYDRGMMVPTYAGDFTAEILAGLDAVRAKPYVAALYGCDEERLRWLARQAVAYSRSNDYKDLILDDMVFENHEYAWQFLTQWSKPDAAAKRLSEMLDYGLTNYKGWRLEVMWRSLYRGECFHPDVFERAVKIAEEIEAKKSKRVADESNDDKRAVYEYLAAFINSIEKKTPPNRTAAEYRDWLEANRQKLKAKKVGSDDL